MFDPRMFEKALTKRSEEARESAKQFAADFEAGKLDVAAPGFNQGMFEQAQQAEPAAGEQHACTWQLNGREMVKQRGWVHGGERRGMHVVVVHWARGGDEC
jgi:hypothetical protein